MKFEFTPVGIFESRQKYRFETPRQSIYAENRGVIVLNDDPHLEEACRDLAGIERIWVVFCFHLNEGWRPFIQPPVSPGGRRVSTFATRAPYRPNPIGISCVELEQVKKNRIYIRNSDLLDGTPVLDIKPYIPAVDSFPGSLVGWLDEANAELYEVSYQPEAMERICWIRENGGPDLENFCSVQLVLDPLNRKRKRLSFDGGWRIGCRTWQIHFSVQDKKVTVNTVSSNYSAEDLNSSEDKYGDKDLHRKFINIF